jgi:N12 class adenine-specific DNA methylase
MRGTAFVPIAADPRYQRNVTALEKTLPEDLKPSDITARLGAPWIPADVVAAFAEEVLGGYRQVNEFGVDDWVSAGHVDSP